MKMMMVVVMMVLVMMVVVMMVLVVLVTMMMVVMVMVLDSGDGDSVSILNVKMMISDWRCLLHKQEQDADVHVFKTSMLVLMWGM